MALSSEAHTVFRMQGDDTTILCRFAHAQDYPCNLQIAHAVEPVGVLV